MPLKHPTETFCVFLLGVMVAAAGVAVNILPPLPAGAVAWGGALLLAVGYALLLHPLLKANRADNSFRALHFLPLLMLLLWLFLQVGASYDVRVAPLLSWYTWGWTLPAVTVGFVLLVLFCIRVIRCWVFRCGVLIILFVPFASLAVMHERGEWSGLVASVLQRGKELVLLRGGDEQLTKDAAEVEEEERTLVASADPGEEGWRRRLRRMERREERIDQKQEEGEGKVVVPTVASSRLAVTEQPPPILPSSGGEIEFLVLLALAGYCGVLQQRGMRRKLVVSHSAVSLGRIGSV